MKMKKYEITTEEYEAVVKARKATQNKRIARRLRVIELRYEGKTSKEIAEKLDMNWMYISYYFSSKNTTNVLYCKW